MRWMITVSESYSITEDKEAKMERTERKKNGKRFSQKLKKKRERAKEIRKSMN